MPTLGGNSGFSPAPHSKFSDCSLVRAQLELGETPEPPGEAPCCSDLHFCSCSEPGTPLFTSEEISHVEIEEPGHRSQD